MRKAVDRALNGQTVNGLTRTSSYRALIGAVVDQQS
jgi:hypothetical protein